MSLPLDNRQWDNLLTTTIDAKLPRLIDNFYTSMPLLVRLRTRDAIRHEGGASIRTPFIYGKMPGNSYGRGDTFNTSTQEFMTDLALQWKYNYASFTIFGPDIKQNAGAARIIDLVEANMKNCEMTLSDNIATQLFADGSGNAGKDVDGLAVAVDNVLAYGGITRDSSAQGTAVKAQVNTTGGPFSLAMVNDSFGTATFAGDKPDLLISGQTIWNKAWERIQPQQRFASEDMKKVGMEGINFNGADWVVDQHCPAGVLYGLNTKYIEFWILQGGDFTFRQGGGTPIYNQDAITDQMILYANLVVTGPRYQFKITNIT